MDETVGYTLSRNGVLFGFFDTWGDANDAGEGAFGLAVPQDWDVVAVLGLSG